MNLSGIEHTTTNVIMNNHAVLDNCTTKDELVNTLTKLFNENDLNTPKCKKIIDRVKKQKTYESALITIYNSFLCGSGLSVI